MGLRLAAFLGTRGEDAQIREANVASSLGWSPWLALQCAFAVLAAAMAANASRVGQAWAVPGFYAAIAAIFLPAAARIMHPGSSRTERLVLLVVVTAALFMIRVVRAPVAFVDHDEFLHWVTANDILETGRLFVPNPLLPVSPVYPGLELVTAALSSVSGASVFAAALMVLAAARLSLIVALFLFFERIAGSARIGAVACLIYMGSSAFLIFDLHFSYESLAIPFLATVLFAAVMPGAAADRSVRHLTLVVAPLLFALALTHHLTSFFAAAALGATASLEWMQRGADRSARRYGLVVAALAVAVPVAWSKFVGDPTSGYLGPVIVNGVHEVVQLVNFASGRTLFVSDTGVVAPAWQRYTTIAGVGLICLGLLTGFLRSFALNNIPFTIRNLASPMRMRNWTSSALVVFTLLTLAYPASVVFRLTRSGWELGNRIGSLSFFGVAIVLAVAIAGFWQGASRNRLRMLLLAGAATVVLLAGIISSEGPRILVPQKYEVSADSSSIEPMGISAAEWTREWLGPGNLFASDRINRLLLSTYGRQSVATTLQNWRDTSLAILSPGLGRSEREVLIDAAVSYILVDLRITTALPGVGVYFDGGEADRNHVAPPPSSALLKFNDETTVDRLFDNGFLVIFDVARLADGR